MRNVFFLLISLQLLLLPVAASAKSPKKVSSAKANAAAKAAANAADKVALAQLHDTINRMARHEVAGYIYWEQKELARRTSSREWLAELADMSDLPESLLPDSIIYRATPTLYDIVMREDAVWEDELLCEWQAFHAADADPLPRYSVLLRTAECKGVDSAYLADYDSLPDSWERGMLLLLGDHSLYSRQTTYLERYPHSPIAPAVSRVVEQMLMPWASVRFDNYLSSADSLQVSIFQRNVRCMALEIYRLPAGYTSWGANQTPSEEPFSSEETFSSEEIFSSEQATLPASELMLVRTDTLRFLEPVPNFGSSLDTLLAPLPRGRYLLYPALPNEKHGLPIDSLPVDNIESQILRVSDLRGMGVVDARGRRLDFAFDPARKQPVEGFRVEQDENDRWWLSAGGDTVRYSQPSAFSYEPFTEVRLFPNSNLCHAGDTLRLAAVAMTISPHGRRPLAAAEAHFTLRSPEWENVLDTTVLTDDYGMAEMAFVFTDAMRRGDYRVYCKAGKRSGTERITFADYKMPTASLTVTGITRDTLLTVSGLALRANGMPIRDLDVSGRTNMPNRQLDFSTRTDADGRFAYTFSRSLSDSLRMQYVVWMSFEAVTLDGEPLSAVFTARNPDSPEEAARKDSLLRIVPYGEAFKLMDEGEVAADGSVCLVLRVAEDQLAWLCLSDRDSLLRAEWVPLKKGLDTLRLSVPLDDDNYLKMTIFGYAHGGSSSHSCTYLSPNSHTVRIVPEVMRDYLRPGLQEEWRFRLVDRQGKPQEGRMILSLNNLALRTIRDPKWSVGLPQPWRQPFVCTYATSIFRQYSIAAIEELDGFSYPAIPLTEEHLLIRQSMRSNGAMYTLSDDMVEENEEEVFCVVAPQAARKMSEVSVRKTDTSVALYRTNLLSDRRGRLRLRFLTPQDNTSWLLQAVAWTRDGATGGMTDTLQVKRSVTAHLSLPRFLRTGDRVELPAVVANASERTQKISVLLELFDPSTDSVCFASSREVKLRAGEETILPMPAEALREGEMGVRIRALASDGCSDGEQRLLPVRSIIERVREFAPFCTRDTLVTLTLPERPANAQDERVELTYCTSPLPSAVRALPSWVDTSAVTSTQLMHALYCAAIANRLAMRYPSLREWLDTRSIISKLLRYQTPSGAFRWLESADCSAGYWTTCQIAWLMDELHYAQAMPGELSDAYERTKTYLQANERYVAEQRMLDSLSMDLPVSRLAIWPSLALRHERAGRHSEALQIVNALRRYCKTDPVLGMYWENIPDCWRWMRTSEIEASFLLAFATVDPREDELAAMRQWLVLNRHTNRWGNSSLAAYCSYALMEGLDSIAVAEMDTAQHTIALPADTRTYTLHLPADNKSATLGALTVSNKAAALGALTVSNSAAALGALTVSYQAPATQVAAHGTPALSITREYYLYDGQTYQPIPADTTLEMGDKVMVRLTIRTDREFDNLILTDRRLSLLEPENTRSGYAWMGALYYREVRHDRTVYYISHVSRGTGTIDCKYTLTTRGTAHSGLADITSDLAPEYTSHTASERIEVR